MFLIRPLNAGLRAPYSDSYIINFTISRDAQKKEAANDFFLFSTDLTESYYTVVASVATVVSSVFEPIEENSSFIIAISSLR